MSDLVKRLHAEYAEWKVGDVVIEAANRITALENALRDIVNDTHVGKRGACVLRSKYGNYAAKYYYAARAVLNEGNDSAA